MLQNYPSTGTLDLNIEQHIPQDAQLGLQDLMERSKLFFFLFFLKKKNIVNIFKMANKKKYILFYAKYNKLE
jgi:hypothetical protein